MYYYYDIYVNNIYVKSVDDLDYATYYLLTNKNSYYYIYSYSNTKDCSILEGCIKIVNNKVIKIIDDMYVSTYSPYDLYLFKRSDLSRLYLNFYNNDADIHQNINQNIHQNKIQPFNNKQTNISVNLNDKTDKTDKTDKNDKIDKTDKNDVPVISSNEIPEFKNILNDLTNMNTKLTEIKKSQEEELINKACEEQYNKKQKRLENERNKEKYNIFISDIIVYNKLINEEKFSESFIPPFFEAKYYILKYLYSHNYFDEEDSNKPSDELFLQYKLLYDYINNDFEIDSEYKELYDLFEDFKDNLPTDKYIKTDRQIMISMNGDDKENNMFVEPTGYELDTDSSCDLDSKSYADLDAELDVELDADLDDDLDDDLDSNLNDNNVQIIDDIYNDVKKYLDLININNFDINKVDESFKNTFNVIKFMFYEGYFDKIDIIESIIDSIDLYKIICDYSNNYNINKDVFEMFKPDFESYDKFINNK